MRHYLKIFLLAVIVQISIYASDTFAAPNRDVTDKNDIEDAAVYFLGVEGIAAPLGDGKAYVLKAGLDGGV